MNFNILLISFFISTLSFSQVGEEEYMLSVQQKANEGGTPVLTNYNWDTATDNDADWVFTTPAGTGLQGAATAQRWSWDNNDTPSTDVGPSSGQGGNPDGYIFVEATGASANIVCTMELVATLDADANHLSISFYTNQRGTDNNVTIVMETNEASAGWVERGATFGGPSDPNKVSSGGTDVWVSRTVDFTGLVSDASTKIRLKLTFPSTANLFNNDYGLDTFVISVTPK